MRLSCREAGELGRAAMFWKVCAEMFGGVNRLISSWNSEANVARSRRSHTFQRPRPSSSAARQDSLAQSLVVVQSRKQTWNFRDSVCAELGAQKHALRKLLGAASSFLAMYIDICETNTNLLLLFVSGKNRPICVRQKPPNPAE